MCENTDVITKSNIYLPFQFDEKIPSYKRHIVSDDESLLVGMVSCLYDYCLNDMAMGAFPVFPDGCTDLIFFPDEAFSDTLVIRSGTKLEYFSYDMLLSRHVFGVRFLPGGFERIFGCGNTVSMLSYVNELSNIGGMKIKDFYDVTTGMDFENKITWFEKCYSQQASQDKVLEDMAKICNLFIQSRGMYPLKNLENDLYFSNRHLRRMFKHYLGYGLKEMLDIIRFQFIIRECIENSFVSAQQNVADNFGFSDEFQLSRFCKKMTGLSFSKMKDVLF